MSKKLPTELTNEELLKALETETIGNSPVERLSIAVKELKFLDKVHAFISKYNIKPGAHKILSKHLYNLFKLEYSEYKLAYFTKRMKSILPSDKARHDTMFLIDKDILNISESIEKILFKGKKRKSHITKQRNYKKHIEAFINFFKLDAGQNAIVYTIIADLYDRWTYKTKKKKLSPNILSSLLQLYLPHKLIKNERYFYVNNDIFKVVSKRQLETIKKFAEETIKRTNA